MFLSDIVREGSITFFILLTFIFFLKKEPAFSLTLPI